MGTVRTSVSTCDVKHDTHIQYYDCMDDTDHDSGAAGAFMGWSRNTSAKLLQELAEKTSPGF